MKYRVYMTNTSVYFMDVEADSPDAAQQEASENTNCQDWVLSSTNDWAPMQVEPITEEAP